MRQLHAFGLLASVLGYFLVYSVKGNCLSKGGSTITAAQLLHAVPLLVCALHAGRGLTLGTAQQTSCQP
jgi:hypothetical protein